LSIRAFSCVDSVRSTRRLRSLRYCWWEGIQTRSNQVRPATEMTATDRGNAIARSGSRRRNSVCHLRGHFTPLVTDACALSPCQYRLFGKRSVQPPPSPDGLGGDVALLAAVSLADGRIRAPGSWPPLAALPKLAARSSDSHRPTLAEPGTGAWHRSLTPEPGTRAWHPSLAPEPGARGAQCGASAHGGQPGGQPDVGRLPARASPATRECRSPRALGAAGTGA